MKKLSLLIFLLGNISLTIHLAAMDMVPQQSFSQPQRPPRPPAEKFAYYPCIPALTTLAIMAIPDEQPKGKDPLKLMADINADCGNLYIYATHFKENPNETNPVEALKLKGFSFKEYEDKAEQEYEREVSSCINKEQTQHLLAHANLTQEMLNNLLLTAGRSGDLHAIKLLVARHARGRFFERWEKHPLCNAIVRHAFLGERLTFDHPADGSLSYSFVGSDGLKTESLPAYNIDEKVNDMSPLKLAAAYNDAATVEELVPFSSQKNKNNALLAAIAHGANTTIMPLISHGAAVNSKGDFDRTPLHEAATKGYTNIAQLLIANGADVNAKESYHGYTSLHESAKNGHIDTAQILIANGANVNIKNKNKETPLHEAASLGLLNMAQLLIDNGADVNAKNDFCYTPIFFASESGHTATIQLLITNGAEVTTKTKGGRTPIFLAAQRGRTSAVQLLIDNGANVNETGEDCTKYTPLHIATVYDHTNIVKLLITVGASVTLKDIIGRTPLDIAKEKKKLDMINLLEEATLKKSSCK